MHSGINSLLRRIAVPVLVLGICLFTACGSGHKPSDYVRFIEDPANGFVQSATKGSTSLECIYLPTDYMAVQYFKRNDIDRSEYEKVKNDMKNTLYFKIIIHGLKDMQVPQGYFDFGFQQQIEGTLAGADLKPAFYLPEPDNTMKDEKQILIGFPVEKTPSKCDITIHWIDETDVFFSFTKLNENLPSVNI
ncbi:MAG: hypothetical protein ACT6QS_02340 [Flavobacteriales bacterium]